MGKEEQAEELEILESIYPDELEVQTDTSFSLHLKLETDAPRQLLVQITYPEDYPEDSIPMFGISAEDAGEDAGEETADEPKFTYEYTKSDCAELEAKAREIAEENVGMASVFTVVSTLKETAEELYEARIRDQEAERLKRLAIEEEKEQAKFRGTPVTKESFAKWRAAFRAELGLDKPKERPFGRYTGKELFEKGIYEEDEDVDDGEPEREAVATA